MDWMVRVYYLCACFVVRETICEVWPCFCFRVKSHIYIYIRQIVKSTFYVSTDFPYPCMFFQKHLIFVQHWNDMFTSTPTARREVVDHRSNHLGWWTSSLQPTKNWDMERITWNGSILFACCFHVVSICRLFKSGFCIYPTFTPPNTKKDGFNPVFLESAWETWLNSQICLIDLGVFADHWTPWFASLRSMRSFMSISIRQPVMWFCG